MRAVTEHVVPGRWADSRPMTDKEYQATLIAAVPITEASAKVRTGGPVDDDPDYGCPSGPAWSPSRWSRVNQGRIPSFAETSRSQSTCGGTGSRGSATMKGRTVAELVIGALYATGAGFQAFDTLRKSEEFYRDMANQAWLRPAELFVERVLVPNSFTVTVLVVVFQATLAIAIFSRGAAVRPALLAGGVFSIVGALTGGPAETVGYAVLSVIHFRIASKRVETLPAGSAWSGGFNLSSRATPSTPPGASKAFDRPPIERSGLRPCCLFRWRGRGETSRLLPSPARDEA